MLSNFDNVGDGFLTLFEVATLEGWVQVMHDTMDITDIGQQPVADNTPAHALFFVVFISFGSFFVMNLLIAVSTEQQPHVATDARHRAVTCGHTSPSFSRCTSTPSTRAAARGCSLASRLRGSK